MKLIFNSTNEDARGREFKHKFIFKSDAVNYNNKTVYLKMLEPIEGTSKYSEYKKEAFIINISISSEFDDF